MKINGGMTLRLPAIGLVSIALLAACATLPRHEAAPRPPSPPPWVETAPQAADGFTYFVGSGTAAANNSAAAEEKAVQSLAARVVAAVEKGVEGRLTPASRDDLKTLEERLQASARGSTPSNPGGLTVTDRWVERRGVRITVFLLARYTTSALHADRARLVALERERSNPVSVAQARGEQLLSNGNPYAAAVDFLQAALAASRKKNGAEELRTSIGKAGAALSELRVEVVTNDLRGSLGRPLSEPFVLQVTGGDLHRPVVGARFRITYPVLGDNGTFGTGSFEASSDARGRVAIRLPSPLLFGERTVTAELDMSSELKPLLPAVAADKKLLAAFEGKIAAVRAVLHYRTTSQAASIPTGVLVLDLDRGGSPIPEDDTAAGIENALTKAGFHLLPIPSNRSILGIGTPDLIKILRNNFSAKIQRAIVGQARISDFEHNGGNYVVKVSGHVEVADLASGKLLFQTDQVKLSRASDASSAINAAFKDLGMSIGAAIMNRLQ